jgi:hypothetical protein
VRVDAHLGGLAAAAQQGRERGWTPAPGRARRLPGHLICRPPRSPSTPPRPPRPAILLAIQAGTRPNAQVTTTATWWKPVAAPAEDRSRAGPWQWSLRKPGSQGAAAPRGCAGSPSLGSRWPAAESRSAPAGEPMAGRAPPPGRSCTGAPCAGAIEAASRGATMKIDHRGLGRRRLSAASSARNWAWSLGCGCGGAGLPAGGGGPESRPLWHPSTAGRAPSTREGGAAPGRRTTRRSHLQQDDSTRRRTMALPITRPLTRGTDFWHPTGLSHLSDRPSGLDQVQDLAAELQRLQVQTRP